MVADELAEALLRLVPSDVVDQNWRIVSEDNLGPVGGYGIRILKLDLRVRNK